MPHTVTLLVRLEDQVGAPESDPNSWYKRGDIYQVHPYRGKTPPPASNFGVINVSGIPDDITITQLRRVITNMDADYDETDGGQITVLRNRCLLNIAPADLTVAERQTMIGDGVRMLNWTKARFLEVTGIKGRKLRKVVEADLYESYG